jgi:TatD DNase family protein
MVFTDTHCHLDFKVYEACLPFVLRSARAKGVSRFVIPSVARENWGAVRAVVKANKGLDFALGLHPVFHAQHKAEHLQDLERVLSEKGSDCLAVGEIGLDARAGEHGKQYEFFAEQLSIAGRVGLPVIIHSVRSHAKVLTALRTYGINKGVIHAFSGSYEEAKAFVAQGFFLGVGSVICRAGGGKTVEAFKKLPSDALVLETDSPDMYLPSSKSMLGTPLDIARIYQRLCEHRNASREELFAQIERNVDTLFY